MAPITSMLAPRTCSQTYLFVTCSLFLSILAVDVERTQLHKVRLMRHEVPDDAVPEPAAEETRYLPIYIHGEEKLQRVDKNRWRVMAKKGLAYRKSKDLADKDEDRGPEFGQIINVTDEGDGWLRVMSLEAPTSHNATTIPQATTPDSASSEGNISEQVKKQEATYLKASSERMKISAELEAAEQALKNQSANINKSRDALKKAAGPLQEIAAQIVDAKKAAGEVAKNISANKAAYDELTKKNASVAKNLASLTVKGESAKKAYDAAEAANKKAEAAAAASSGARVEKLEAEEKEAREKTKTEMKTLNDLTQKIPPPPKENLPPKGAPAAKEPEGMVAAAPPTAEEPTPAETPTGKKPAEAEKTKKGHDTESKDVKVATGDALKD